MQLPDLKHLSKIIDLCKKKGVSHITIGDISLTISDLPIYPPTSTQAPATSQIEEDWKEPSPEELLFWSAESPESKE